MPAAEPANAKVVGVTVLKVAIAPDQAVAVPSVPAELAGPVAVAI